MNTRILFTTDPQLPREVEATLEKGGLLVFPTDTVFGVGGNPWDVQAVERVRFVKGRSPDQPFTLHLPTIDMIGRFASVSPTQWEILEHFLPGPYTFLLRSAHGVPPSVEKEGKVGIRVPNHPFFSTVMANLGRSLFGTSVNRSGEPPLLDIDQILERFSGVDLVIRGSGCTGTSSVIIDLTVKPPRTLRGALPDALR